MLRKEFAVAKEEFPISKSDVHYDSTTQEVTLPRAKFDALISYVQDLVKQASAAEDERDIAQYQKRRTTASESVLQQMVNEAAELTSKSVSKWLESHSIRQLSERTGIPYATCYRIVNERLNTSRIDVETLGKFAEAIQSADQNKEQPLQSRDTEKEEQHDYLAAEQGLERILQEAQQEESAPEAESAKPKFRSASD